MMSLKYYGCRKNFHFDESSLLLSFKKTNLNHKNDFNSIKMTLKLVLSYKVTPTSTYLYE